jgi:predicted AAA+ superfamily ATPase
MLRRRLLDTLLRRLDEFPVVGLLGPRQVGKTTLAHALAQARPTPIHYLDLERDTDRRKLDDAESYLGSHRHELVVLDEVQRRPEIFPLLRGLVDERIREGKRAGHFLILGSASPSLLRQSSESLAGRIVYLDLAPFTLGEFKQDECTREFIDRLWLRGGYAPSLFATNDETSREWRRSFIETYLERDLPQFAPRIPTERLRRFWSMLAFNQGNPWNGSQIAAALEVSVHTVKHYLEILVDLGLTRLLKPWSGNSLKRLVRAPKVYVRDSGIVHRLTNVPDLETLLGHPSCGNSWEGFVLEQLLTFCPTDYEATYFRTATRHEIDLVLEGPRSRVLAIEIKRSRAPELSRGFLVGCEEVKATERFVVVPDGESYSIGNGTKVIGLRELVEYIAGVEPLGA